MSAGLAVLLAGIFTVSLLLTRLMRALAVPLRLIDVPNFRSSHAVPTARGGGVAIVLTSAAFIATSALRGAMDPHLASALLVGGLAVAAVGLIDDLHPVRAAIRFGVHCMAALYAVNAVGGLAPVDVFGHVVRLGAAGLVLAFLGTVWVLNLFNFMDGIDGIAASEAIFISAAGAALGGLALRDYMTYRSCLAFAAACAGFLAWNWPPAKIFMGDVGSGFIGFTLAVLALWSTRSDPATPWIWMILCGTFFVDATVTLIRRVMRGERGFEPHRSHAYQHLARRWGAHRKVTVGFIAVNVFWLLPCAGLAALHPAWALGLVAVAYAPLVVLALICGSGNREAT